MEPKNEMQYEEDLVKAMEELAVNSQRREELGREGRKRIELLYSWDRKIDNLIEVYRSVYRSWLKKRKF